MKNANRSSDMTVCMVLVANFNLSSQDISSRATVCLALLVEALTAFDWMAAACPAWPKCIASLLTTICADHHLC